MLFTDEEFARLQTVAPFLLSEARTSLLSEAEYEFTMELAEHLQPGLRVRAPDLSAAPAKPDVPPYALDLFVGIPLAELRALAHADDEARDAAIAQFGATFSPRLLRAIAKMTPNEIDLDAGVQSEAGTLSVMLDEIDASWLAGSGFTRDPNKYPDGRRELVMFVVELGEVFISEASPRHRSRADLLDALRRVRTSAKAADEALANTLSFIRDSK